MTPTSAFYALIVSVLFFAGCSSVNTLAALLPEEDGAPSSVVVGTSGGTVTLDRPLSAAAVDNRGKIEPKVLTNEEVKQNFGDALSAQPPRAITFTLYFETNSAQINAASIPVLEALLREVEQRAAVEVQVTGHTDRVGSVEDNDRLSQERAEAVRSMLIQRGMRASFIRAVGRGEREPLVPTADEQPEPRNRRVEVIVR